MTEMTDFMAGRPCELHDVAFCADCQKRLGLRRGVVRSGEEANGFYFSNDCAIASYCEITGSGYDESVEALASGFNPRTGTKVEAIKTALESAGFRLEKRGLGHVTARGTRYNGLTLADARSESVTGRVFLLIGSDSRGAHAWTVIDGKANRAYLRAPYRYGILEVVA